MDVKEEIAAIIRDRGAAITQSDITAIEVLLTQVPLDEVHEIEGGVWESLWLIVNDPLYEGTIRI